MSLSGKEQSCALCHAYLFEEDDVVYCPVCGAPHHRECYNSSGHCALEEFHGTENQYDKLKAAAEQEEKKSAEEPKEEHQNFETPFGGFTPFDFLGGVHPEAEIDEGVKAKDAAKFVMSNTMRYIPKFMRLGKPKKASFNFLAFFFPGSWMLSRKMYTGGIIACFVEILSTLFTVPFQNVLYNLGYRGSGLSPEQAQEIAGNIGKIDPLILVAAAVGAFIALTLKIVVGVFGDWFYKKHTIKNVREINQSTEDKTLLYRKKGGVNIFMFLIGMMAVQYIPVILWNLV